VKIRKIKENMRREKRRPMIIEVNAEDLIHVTTMIKSERIRTVLPPKKKDEEVKNNKTSSDIVAEANQDESILREKALKQILENSMKEKKKTP